jgi:hypothetical protein
MKVKNKIVWVVIAMIVVVWVWTVTLVSLK